MTKEVIMTAISTIIQSSPVLSSPNVSVSSTAAKAPSVVQTIVPAAVSAATSSNSSAQKTEDQPSVRDVQKAVAQANSSLANANHSITFGYEEKLGQLIVQVSDNATGRVIQQLPSKDFIKHQIFMKEMVGLLLDKQA